MLGVSAFVLEFLRTDQLRIELLFTEKFELLLAILVSVLSYLNAIRVSSSFGVV